MDKRDIIYTSEKYVNTLHSIGGIHPKEMYQLAIIMFLNLFEEKFILSDIDHKNINRIINCFKKAGCLVKTITVE